MKLCCYSVDSWSDFNRVVHVVHVFECKLYIIFSTTFSFLFESNNNWKNCVTLSISLQHSSIFIMCITLVIDRISILLCKNDCQLIVLVHHGQIIDCCVLYLLIVLTLIAVWKNSEISGYSNISDGKNVFQLILDIGIVQVKQMIWNSMKLIRLAPCVSIESNLYYIVVQLMLKSKENTIVVCNNQCEHDVNWGAAFDLTILCSIFSCCLILIIYILAWYHTLKLLVVGAWIIFLLL